MLYVGVARGVPTEWNRPTGAEGSLILTADGGKTWQTLSGTHGDFHDMWINPDNPGNFVISNDGGAAVTLCKITSFSELNSPSTFDPS